MSKPGKNDRVRIPQFGAIGMTSDRERRVFDVLDNPRAGHLDRVWLAGFLLNRFSGDVDAVCVVIGRHCQWGDYNPYTTSRQVHSVKKSMGKPSLGWKLPELTVERFQEIYEELIQRRRDEKDRLKQTSPQNTEGGLP